MPMKINRLLLAFLLFFFELADSNQLHAQVFEALVPASQFSGLYERNGLGYNTRVNGIQGETGLSTVGYPFVNHGGISSRITIDTARLRMTFDELRIKIPAHKVERSDSLTVSFGVSRKFKTTFEYDATEIIYRQTSGYFSLTPKAGGTYEVGGQGEKGVYWSYSTPDLFQVSGRLTGRCIVSGPTETKVQTFGTDIVLASSRQEVPDIINASNYPYLVRTDGHGYSISMSVRDRKAFLGTVDQSEITADIYAPTIGRFGFGGFNVFSRHIDPTIAAAPSIISAPVSQTSVAGSVVRFAVNATGKPEPTYQWLKNGAYINGATSANLELRSVATSDSGSYQVVVTNLVDAIDSTPAVLTVTAAQPTISLQPISTAVVAGGITAFSVTVNGTPPLSYQWQKDGAAITGATASALTIGSAVTSDAGNYAVRVTNSAGSVVSNAAVLTVTAPRLSNLSVRTTLDANQVLIVGITMIGGAKNVLLRAVGPTLGAFGVSEVMSDPKLDLYSGSTRVTSNDNWQGLPNLASTFQTVGAFALSSASSLDAALLTSIDGGRTVQVSGPTAGTVLVEGYDAGSGDSPRFSNLSARNKVGTGANILIAGFTLSGAGTRNLLIRAVGPKLADFGVSGVLRDPKVQIYRGQTVIAENDNWASSFTATFTSVGAFGLTTGSKDAALVIPLQAGSYSVQVSGADGGTGEAIVEIYELP